MPIVEIYHRGALLFGSSPAVEAGTPTAITFADGSTIVAPKTRILRVHAGDEQAADLGLRRVSGAVEQAAAAINIELLWERISADGDQSTIYTIHQISQLAVEQNRSAFADVPESICHAAVFHALASDNIFFNRLKDGGYRRIGAAEQVEIQSRLIAQARIEEDSAALFAFLDASRVETALPASWVTRIRAWIAGQEDAAISNVFSGADGRQSAFEFMCERGGVAWKEDFAVVEAAIQRAFPPDIDAETAAITARTHAALVAAVQNDSQIDRAQFSIDDPTTMEIDDAISLTTCDGAYTLSVDIADPHRFIARDSPLDRLIRSRSTSIYLPPETIYMMPPQLSTGVLSLVQGQPRPAVRYTITLTRDASPTGFSVDSFDFERRLVRVQRRVDFDTVDRALAQKNDEDSPVFQMLLDIAKSLRKGRKKHGAIFIQRPELSYHVCAETKRVDISVANTRSHARMIVGEIMILVNSLFAKWAQNNAVDIVYRRQNPPDGQLFFRDNDPFSLLRSRGRLLPSFLSTSPGQHAGLGLDAYCQVTSPLRRYGDLVNSRQALAIKAGDTPIYQRSELTDLIGEIETKDKAVGRVYQSSNRRWFLEYLVNQPSSRRYPGCLASRVQGGYRVYLSEFAMYGYMRAKDPQKTLLRQQNFRVTDVSVREGKFRCVLA